MSALQRTRIGSFAVADAIDPQTLSPENLSTHITPAIRIVDGIAAYVCTEEETECVAKGRVLELQKSRLTKASASESAARDVDPGPPQVALLSPCGTQLLALGEIRRQGRKIQPRTVFATGQ